jgi:Trk K+ transport system NAD-binding subunit
MVESRLEQYLKNLEYQIEDKNEAILNGVNFDILSTNQNGEKQYIKVVEKKESNDVYSPKGDLNRKIDEIIRLKKILGSTFNFAIAVPNELRYEQILNEKLLSLSIRLNAYLVGDSIIEL